MNPILEQAGKIGIVPVIKIEDIETAVPLAKALDEGGIPIAEVTFRTELAAEAIARIRKEAPQVLTGAGTVLTTDQVDQALEAGAEFIVTPGFNPRVVDYCIEKDVLIIPGASGTSDIEQAIERGLAAVKCFPAQALGGIDYIKSVSGPYHQMLFMPTGGISPQNINDYLSFSKVPACGGSWMVKQELIRDGRYDEITRLCREAVDTVLGISFAHVGINNPDAAQGEKTAAYLAAIFGKPVVSTAANLWPAAEIEVMKKIVPGAKGHIAVGTNNLDRAVFQLQRRGLSFNQELSGVDSLGRRYIFFDAEVSGFAVHLLER